MMFRYVAVSWTPEPVASAAAARIHDQMTARSGWHAVHQTSGLVVYATGCRVGVNDVHQLPDRRGVVLGRIFRRSTDEANAVAGTTDIDLTGDDGDRILRSDGQVLVDDYWGRYVAFLRSWTGTTRVLRDPTGTLPCYLTHTDGATLVFSWLEDVLGLLPESLPPRLNWDAIAGQMLLGRLGSHETCLEGVVQVLPGELSALDATGTERQKVWSAVSFARKPLNEEIDVATRRLRQVVMGTTQSWACCYESILLRLSGGVDSAILLGSLQESLDSTRVTCLNYHSPGSDSDERRYARLAAQRAGTLLVERHRDTEFQLSDVLHAARTPAPSSYLGRMGTGRIDAKTAMDHGAMAMFTGAGGDQVFFELRCTWPAADYLALRGFDRGFFRAALDAAHLGHVSFWRSVRSAVSDRFGRRDALADAGSYVTLMDHGAVEAAKATTERFTHPELLRATDLPIGKFRQVQELISPFDLYDPFLREAAPELVNPLLSQPIAERCLQTPTYILTHGGRGRGLARRAFSGLIPREIEKRRSKGGMQEHVTAVLHSNLELAKSLLLEGNLSRQGLIDRAKVEASLSGHPSAMDGHISEIHNLIAIEAWTQAFTPATVGNHGGSHRP